MAYPTAGTQTAGPGAAGAVTSSLLNGFRNVLQYLSGDSAYSGTQRDRAFIYDGTGGVTLTTTAAAINMNSETIDGANGHATTTYTVQTAGVLEVSGALAVNVTAATSGASLQCWIQKNATVLVGSGGHQPTGAVTGIYIIDAPTVRITVAVNDVIALYGQITGTVTAVTYASSPYASSLAINLETLT